MMLIKKKKKLKNWDIYVYEKKVKNKRNFFILLYILYIEISGQSITQEELDEYIESGEVVCIPYEVWRIQLFIYKHIKKFLKWKSEQDNFLDSIWDIICKWTTIFLHDLWLCIWEFFMQFFEINLSSQDVELIILVFIAMIFWAFLDLYFFIKYLWESYKEKRREFKKWCKEDSIFDDIEQYKKFRKDYLKSDLNKWF